MIKPAALLLLGLAACAGEVLPASGPAGSGPAAGPGAPQTAYNDNPFVALPVGAAQWSILCGRNNADAVSRAFCSGTAPPQVTSVKELQALLGLSFKPGNDANADGGNPAFVLTGNSSSLVARLTSALNPRALVFTPPAGKCCNTTTPVPLQSLVAMGFVRGEEFVELVANDPALNGELRFFLFVFQHACSSADGGCSDGELYGPAVESGFTGYTLYQDVDIANTVVDCLQCHQPAGPGTPKILRMQERREPWTHFFLDARTFVGPSGTIPTYGTPGQVLLDDFHAAHGFGEDYAGIPAAAIEQSGPFFLEALVENQGFSTQPNEFKTGTIEQEVIASNPQEPRDNLPPGDSGTWLGLYANALAGADIPVPYHDVKVSDPGKLAALTAAYQAFSDGGTSSLPDLKDVFLDSALPELSMRAAPGLSGQQILVQMCQQCHNSQLDQTISRARFNVETLSQMSRAEKDVAIFRINLPSNAILRMPPARFRDLSPAEIAAVTQVLQQ